MKRKISFIVIIFVILVGCKVPGERCESKEDSMVEEQNIVKGEVENFFYLMEQNEVGDGKSVYWDGISATEVEDEFDSSDLQDGRWNISGEQVITVGDIFEFAYPDSLDSITVLSDSAEDYHLYTEEYDVHIQQISYEEEVQDASKEENLKRIEEELLSEHQTKYFEEYQLYLGIVDTEKGNYAGYTLFFKSNLADRAYCISVNGTGNMEDIKIVALYVMNHFEVLFE